MERLIIGSRNSVTAPEVLPASADTATEAGDWCSVVDPCRELLEASSSLRLDSCYSSVCGMWALGFHGVSTYSSLSQE
jgi:hypothetical protein